MALGETVRFTLQALAPAAASSGGDAPSEPPASGPQPEPEPEPEPDAEGMPLEPLDDVGDHTDFRASPSAPCPVSCVELMATMWPLRTSLHCPLSTLLTAGRAVVHSQWACCQPR